MGSDLHLIDRDGRPLTDKGPEQTRATLILYLRMKTDEEDWHGVADAAMDLREHDARYPRK